MEKCEEPELDFASEKFDALAALTRPNDVQVPEPEAPIYDNLGMFVSVMKRTQAAKQMSASASSTSQDVILFVHSSSIS